MKNFKTTDITYHRNGCSGRGFYSVRFSYDDDGFKPNMVAILPADLVDGTSFQECYVLDLNDPTSNWRGDQFAYDVRAAIKVYQKDMWTTSQTA